MRFAKSFLFVFSLSPFIASADISVPLVASAVEATQPNPGRPLTSVKMVSIIKLIETPKDDQLPGSQEVYINFRDGVIIELADTVKNMDEPVCVLKLDVKDSKKPNSDELLPITPVDLEAVSVEADPEMSKSTLVRDRALSIKFHDPLVKELVCISPLAGRNVPPTVEQAQKAVHGFMVLE